MRSFVVVVFASALAACVPVGRLESAQTALEAERSARASAEAAAATATERATRAEAQSRSAGERGRQALSRLEAEHADAQLRLARVEVELRDALAAESAVREVTSRLETELQRLAVEREELTAALHAAESRGKRLEELEADANALLGLTRDLALVFAPELRKAVLRFHIEGGRPELVFRAPELVDARGQLSVLGERWLGRVANAARAYGSIALRVEEHSPDPDGAARTRRLAMLSERLGATLGNRARVIVGVAPKTGAVGSAERGGTVHVALIAER